MKPESLNISPYLKYIKTFTRVVIIALVLGLVGYKGYNYFGYNRQLVGTYDDYVFVKYKGLNLANSGNLFIRSKDGNLNFKVESYSSKGEPDYYKPRSVKVKVYKAESKFDLFGKDSFYEAKEVLK